MGESYLVCPPEPTDWTVHLDDIAAGIGQRWPAATVDTRPADVGGPCVRWELEPPTGWLEGSVAEDGPALHLRKGDSQLNAEAVLWFRSLAPTDQPLVLVTGSAGVVLDVLSTTTAADIIAAMSG